MSLFPRSRLAPRRPPEDEPSAKRIESHTLVIESQRRGDGDHYLQLSGELDLACADALTTELLRVEATDARAIALWPAGGAPLHAWPGGVVAGISLRVLDAFGQRVAVALGAAVGAEIAATSAGGGVLAT